MSPSHWFNFSGSLFLSKFFPFKALYPPDLLQLYYPSCSPWSLSSNLLAFPNINLRTLGVRAFSRWVLHPISAAAPLTSTRWTPSVNTKALSKTYLKDTHPNHPISAAAIPPRSPDSFYYLYSDCCFCCFRFFSLYDVRWPWVSWKATLNKAYCYHHKTVCVAAKYTEPVIYFLDFLLAQVQMYHFLVLWFMTTWGTCHTDDRVLFVLVDECWYGPMFEYADCCEHNTHLIAVFDSSWMQPCRATKVPVDSFYWGFSEYCLVLFSTPPPRW